MDINNKEMIRKAHGKFLSNDFSEVDVKSFFIDIREDISNPLIKEICHFFAHRKRDRGMVMNYAKDKYKFLSGEKVGKMEIKTIVSTEILYRQLNDVFKNMGLSELSKRTINDILLYIIVILQGVIIYDGKNKQIGSLNINYDKDEIRLNVCLDFVRKTDGAPINFVIPVMKVDNYYTQRNTIIEGIDANVCIELNRTNGIIQMLYGGIVL